MKDKILTRVFSLFLVLFAVIAVVAALAVRTINRSVASSDWVNHTYATIYEYENITSGLRQAEGYTHTYALTGDPRDLAATRITFGQLGDHLDTAKALIRENKAASQALLEIETQIGEREKFAQSVWAARGAGQTGQVQALLAANAGSAALAAIERGIGKLRDAQFELLRDRDHTAYLQAQTTRWVVSTGIALYFILLVSVAWLLRDDIAARRRAATAMAEANALLEEKVRARTAELLEVNKRLRAENLERKWTITSQEHQLRYNQLIVETVNDPIFVLTKALTVTRINAAVVHLTGLDETAILAKPFGAVVAVAPDPATGLDPVTRALEEGRELRRHPAVALGSGERRIPAYLTLVPLRDQDKVVGGVAVLHVSEHSSAPDQRLPS